MAATNRWFHPDLTHTEDNPRRESKPGPARRGCSPIRKGLPVGKSQALLEAFPSGSAFPKPTISDRANQLAAQILSRRQLIQALELDNGDVLLIFDGSLHFGIGNFGL